jgi:hypothetical protein
VNGEQVVHQDSSAERTVPEKQRQGRSVMHEALAKRVDQLVECPL